ncbi:hypothetical protein KKA95_03795, partial [Patescibacteria group bacterium]|nr:hypothetical protein [Patescibacteria group bacterium]
MFNYFDFVYFFFALLILLMGILVLFDHYRSKNNIIFFLISLSAIAWMLTLYFGYGYADYANFHEGIFWMRLSYGFSILGMSLMTIFIYLFPRPSFVLPNSVKYFYLVITLALFAVAGFTPLVNDFFLVKDGIYIKDTFGPLYFLYATDIIFNLMASVALAVVKLSNIKGIERGKMVYVSYGYFAFVTLAVATNVILPIFDIIVLQREIHVLILAFVMPSYYAIHRYRFLNFSNTTLNLLRKIILYTIFFISIFWIFRLLTFTFPETNVIFVSLLSSFIGLLFIKWIERIFPELITESFREFRNTLTSFKSKIYSCDTYEKLQKLIDDTFLIELNYVNVKLYIIRDKKEKLKIPIY